MTLDHEVTKLFETQRGAVYRYVVTIVGIPAIAEEIVQEAFVRLYVCLRKGMAIEYHRAWVFRAAHNLALNDNARRVRTSATVDWTELCSQCQDSAPDPEQRVLEEESFLGLRTAMAALPALQRQCILLRVEGFRHREIGEILGVSKSTVAESLRRAMRKLKVYFDV